MKIEDIVREVLDSYVDSQVNIDSAVARDILARDIAKRVEYYLTQDEFWKEINEDI